MKFGKVELADLQMRQCDFEPGASALVLGDYGEGEFYVDVQQYYGFKMIRHRRVKIFGKNGLDLANISIPYYAGKTGDVESVLNVRAMCHYLENGTAQSVELPAKDIFNNESLPGHREVKFAIPGVREGCIIEYTYEFRTHDIHNLSNWYFQDNLPTRHSECRLTVPTYFVFQSILHSNRPLDIEDEKMVFQNFSLSNSADTKSDISAQCRRTQWGMRNVPSLKREPFMGASADFIAQIEFQLKQVNYANQDVTDVMPSYEKFNERLLQNDYFGRMAEPDDFARTLVAQITGGLNTPREKAEAILRHLQQQVRWDHLYARYSARTPAKVYKSGTGNTAEIGLLTTACLRAAGIPADPVLIGTRMHARPNPDIPNEERFNFVAVVIDLDGKSLLCDPSTQNLPLGLLPLTCLNGQGWRVSADKAGWINVQEQATGQTNTQVQLQLEGGAWKGKVSFKAADYAAVDALDRMNGDQAAYLQAITNQLGDWSAGPPTLSMLADPFTLAVEAPVQKALDDGKTVYVKPVLTGAVLQNPFSAETREWPVNFPFKDNSSYVFQMPVPEGYTVAETPKDATIVFGTNKDLRFQYRCSVANNILTVTSKFQMNRLLFAVEEYAEIRRTYDMMVQKNQELIVLKKN